MQPAAPQAVPWQPGCPKNVGLPKSKCRTAPDPINYRSWPFSICCANSFADHPHLAHLHAQADNDLFLGVFPILFLALVDSTNHYWITLAKRRRGFHSVPIVGRVNDSDELGLPAMKSHLNLSWRDAQCTARVM